MRLLHAAANFASFGMMRIGSLQVRFLFYKVSIGQRQAQYLF